MRSAVTSALLVTALVADSRLVAYYLVLAAIPAAAVAALGYYGELVDGSADAESGALNVGLSALALLLCLISAAARTNGGEALGLTAVVAALVLLALQLAVWTALHVSRERIVATLRSRA
jgi:hypothetical protein